jgi:hypothetical protein
MDGVASGRHNDANADDPMTGRGQWLNVAEDCQ